MRHRPHLPHGRSSQHFKTYDRFGDAPLDEHEDTDSCSYEALLPLFLCIVQMCLDPQEVAAGVRHFKELLAAAEAEAKVPRTTRSGKPYSAPSSMPGNAPGCPAMPQKSGLWV